MNKDLGIIILFSWMAFCAIKLIQCFVRDFVGSKLSLNSSYPKLVKEVLHYCAPIFRENSIKYYPLYEVSHYPSKKKLGCYFSGKKKIVIYVKSHEGNETQRLRLVVHTILHEIRHVLQHHTDSNFKNYDILSRKLTYQKNPFEIDANAFADKHLDDCIKYLKQQGIVS